MSDLKNEWSLQATLAAAPSMTRAQANHIAADVATSKMFAYGSGNAVLVRDIENPGTVLLCPRHSVAVTVARISPNGLLVASGDKDGNVIIWANRPDTAEKYKSKLLNGAVRDISWTEDSERLIIVGEGRGDYAAVITVSGSSIGEITGHTQNIVTCDFKKNKPFKVFTGGADTKTSFYEGPPFKFTHSIPSTFKNAVTCVRVSPDNTTVACVSGGNEIVLLDSATGKQTKSITTDHQGTIYSVSWAPNGKVVATASADKSVKTYSVEDGTQKSSTTFGKSIHWMQQSAFFSAAGLTSVALNGCISLLGEDGGIRRQWYGHQKHILGLYHDQGTNAFVSVGADGTILKWAESAAGSAAPISMDSDVITATTALPGIGKYAVVAGTDLCVFDGHSAQVTVLCKDANHAVGIAAVASGHFVLLYKSAVVVFDASGKKTAEEKIPQFDGTSIAGAGSRVVLGGDKVARLYDVSGQGQLSLVSIFQGSHTGTVTAVAFSPDGSRVASGDSTKAIFVWSADSTPKIIYENLTFHTLRVTALFFESPTRLYSGSVDCSVIRWDLEDKKRRIQDYAHRGGVTAIAPGAHGEIVTAGGDYCIRRWKAE